MNKILYLLFLLPLVSLGQSNDRSNIKTSVYKEPTTVTDESKANSSITYYDNFGRPIQQNARKSSGSEKDIVTHIEYDEYGRQRLNYLPYEPSISNGYYKYDAKHNTELLYNSAKYEQTLNPYSEDRYEQSPLNRIIEQGAPGGDWKLPELINMEVAGLFSIFDQACLNSLLLPNTGEPAGLLLPDPILGISVKNNTLTFTLKTNLEGSAYLWWLYPGCTVITTPVSISVLENISPYYNLQNVYLGMLKDSFGESTGYKIYIQNQNIVFVPEVQGALPLARTFDTTLKLDLTPYIRGQAHSVKYGYTSNGAVEVKRFGVSFPTGNTEKPELIIKGYYGSGQLYKTITKNENWKSNQIFKKDNTTEEFTDKEGRVILKRTFDKNKVYDTFYVYDDYGNLTYVIPPAASDAVVTTTYTILPGKRNFPWTKLSLTTGAEASRYEAKLAGIDNSDILNADFSADNFTGRGGFSLIPDENNNLTLNINITTDLPTEYRTGAITDLSEIGNYPDKELGRIAGDGYEYIFSIAGNMVMVDGYGKVPSMNTSLTGGNKLEYSKNYPWTKLCEVDSRIAAQFEDGIVGLDNSAILTADVPNDNGAKGGISVSLDEFDTLTLSMNITSQVPMELAKGVVFVLDINRSIPDRTLGSISGSGYQYDFEIRDNSLFITGSGYITNFMHFFSHNISAVHEMNQQAVSSMCYIYHYDKYNRVVEKHIPDNGWTHIVYDRLDRPVLSQDENMRLTNEWLFTKYDEFDRTIMTGKYDNSYERSYIQSQIINGYALSETRYNSPYVGHPGGFYLYYSTDQAFPPSGELLSIQYYDTYEDSRDTLPSYIDIPDEVFGKSIGETKGLATYSHVKVLDGSNFNWITSAVAYDDKGRMIWERSDNPYLNSSDVTEHNLDFTGKPTETRRTHAKNGETLVVQDFFEYDSMSRVTRQSQSINGNPAEVLVYNHYDELGKLDKKKVGVSLSTDYELSTGLQTVDYSYNIRGWLKGINNDTNNDNDLFNFGVKYSDAGDLSLYNGNIAQTSWNYGQGGLRRYDYHYDALNRLRDADSYNSESYLQYSEKGISYDKNGNILTLSRKGLLNHSYGTIDDLKYIYKPFSNQLLKVTDEGQVLKGFNDLNTGEPDDYAYDAAGNMVTDLNKEIGQTDKITYNHFNLPEKIVKNPGNQIIIYTYDATGQKLAKKVISSSVPGGVTTTHYANGFIYENNILQYFQHPEGYVRLGAEGFAYIYQYKDHLGNIRVSYADNDGSKDITSGEIIEKTDYYPFGMQHEIANNAVTSTNIAQKIKYNGKELQDELELGVYDYGARNYDPGIGRWSNIDPMAEQGRRFSPYVYAFNNPVYFIDPDGMWPWPTWNQVKSFASGVKSGVTNYAGKVTAHIKNEVKGLKNAYTSPTAALSYAAKHSGPAILYNAVASTVSTPINTVKNIASGNYKALGEAYGEHLATAATVAATDGAIRTGNNFLSKMTGSFAAEVPSVAKKTVSGAETLAPGEFASGSIPARSQARNFTSEERNAVNAIGDESGCHTCGTFESGTKSGNWVLDHQPASALVPEGTPQELYPHCIECSNKQGGTVSGIVRKNKTE